MSPDRAPFLYIANTLNICGMEKCADEVVNPRLPVATMPGAGPGKAFVVNVPLGRQDVPEPARQ